MQHRKAVKEDLPTIVSLLANDKLGKIREKSTDVLEACYLKAFEHIDSDPNQFLMVITLDNAIVGTCHLTLMPSLTFRGSLRMQVEAVRIHEEHRGKKIGEWMLEKAIQYAKERDVKIIQLSTNKERDDALCFYKKLGFKGTHEGMKLYL